MADIKAPSDNAIIVDRECYWDCFPEEDAETQEFYRQSIEHCGPDRHREPGRYFPVIRVPASQLLQPLSVRSVYEHWCETGKIATIQPGYTERNLDTKTMLAAYRFGLEMSRARCADFRDAIMDALAESFDAQTGSDIGLFHGVFKAVENVPNSNLERLLAFHIALSTDPGCFNSILARTNKQFLHHVHEQIKTFPKGVRYYDIWDDFMLNNRCKFHEHPTGRCWRPAESGPEVAPPEHPEAVARRARMWKAKEVEEVDLGDIDWFRL